MGTIGHTVSWAAIHALHWRLLDFMSPAGAFRVLAWEERQLAELLEDYKLHEG